MSSDHVGRILGEQPVALLAGVDRALRVLVHELHHDREPGGIGSRRHGTEQRQHHRRERQGLDGREMTVMTEHVEHHETEAGNACRPGDDAPVGGERSLERHGDHPGDQPGADAAGEPSAISDKAGEIGRRGEMRRSKLAGARYEDGDPDRRQQPEKGGGAEQRRFAVDDEIDGKHAEREQPSEQMRGDERLVARGGQRVAANGLVHERAEIGGEPADTLIT